MLNRSASLLLILLLAFAPSRSNAQVAVFDAASYAQQMNISAQQAQQLINQAQQISYEFQQLQGLVEAGKPLDASTWEKGKDLLTKLGMLLQREHIVAVGQVSLTNIFRRLYPTYVPPKDFDTLYKVWDQTTQDAAQQALDAAKAHMDSVAEVSSAMNDQARRIRTAALQHNQVALLEAGSQIAQMQLVATQNLATIEAVRTQYEVLYYQHQLATGAITEQQGKALEAWQQRGTTASPSPGP